MARIVVNQHQDKMWERGGVTKHSSTGKLASG